ncbi:hypothetical protein MHK_004122 [Candidatus Magnetomorum sp. HK-1]|nr:hypothetical protein MHK_004122 [Candidatus Magnetomorum sp. HK-1]
MPVIYETAAHVAENGDLTLVVKDLPFEKGTSFIVKLIPQLNSDGAVFKRKMQSFINRCEKNNPFKNMSKEHVIAELRRQREEMYA